MTRSLTARLNHFCRSKYRSSSRVSCARCRRRSQSCTPDCDGHVPLLYPRSFSYIPRIQTNASEVQRHAVRMAKVAELLNGPILHASGARQP